MRAEDMKPCDRHAALIGRAWSCCEGCVAATLGTPEYLGTALDRRTGRVRGSWRKR